MSMIEQMLKPELGRKSDSLLKVVSEDCVRNNERQCNIFWLNVKH